MTLKPIVFYLHLDDRDEAAADILNEYTFEGMIDTDWSSQLIEHTTSKELLCITLCGQYPYCHGVPVSGELSENSWL